MEQNITDVTLMPAEKLLASRIQFDEQVLCLIKSMVGRDIIDYGDGTNESRQAGARAAAAHLAAHLRETRRLYL